MSHDELMLDLARHLVTPDRLVWMDMQMGMSGSPRPDVFTLQKSYVRPRPTSYECKISVSDFRSDVTSGKWQSYLKFSQSVTFCVPSGLVKKEDLPNGCGLMVRGESGWQTQRKATLQVATLGIEHLLKLFIDGYGRELGQVEMKHQDMRTAHASKKLAKKFGQHVADVIRDLDSAKRMVEFYNEQSRKRIESAEASAAKIVAIQNEAWAELALALGLPEATQKWEIQRAITNFKRPVETEKTAACIAALNEIQGIARRASL